MTPGDIALARAALAQPDDADMEILARKLGAVEYWLEQALAELERNPERAP
jgi:hypothetical protein